MSENSLAKKSNNWRWWLLLPVWTYLAFWSAQLIVYLVLRLLVWLGVPLTSLSEVLFNTGVSLVVYLVALAVVIGLPWFIWRRRTTRRELGLDSVLSWRDVLITPLSFVAYMIGSAVLMASLVSLFPTVIDLGQSQQLPFSQSMLATQWQYTLAFVTLVVLAPIAEELLFRGYLFGKLRRTSAPLWLSVIITSLTFGLAHLWAGLGSPLQWTVAIDTFALSVVMCLARQYTGALWVPIGMHMLKNGLAFYLLFVNQTVLQQLQTGSGLLPFVI